MPTKYLVLGFRDTVICDDSLRLVRWSNKLQSVMLDIRLNYYRGLHLSNITEFKLKIDDEVVPEADIIFRLNGKEFTLSQLPSLFSEFWGIKNALRLNFLPAC